MYVTQLGGADAIPPARALEASRAAELVALAEQERAAWMRGEAAATLDDLVRLERVAAAAVKSLRLPTPQTKPADPVADVRAYLAAKGGAGR